jgi:hypothetical protein
VRAVLKVSPTNGSGQWGSKPCLCLPHNRVQVFLAERVCADRLYRQGYITYHFALVSPVRQCSLIACAVSTWARLHNSYSAYYSCNCVWVILSCHMRMHVRMHVPIGRRLIRTCVCVPGGSSGLDQCSHHCGCLRALRACVCPHICYSRVRACLVTTCDRACDQRMYVHVYSARSCALVLLRHLVAIIAISNLYAYGHCAHDMFDMWRINQFAASDHH